MKGILFSILCIGFIAVVLADTKDTCSSRVEECCSNKGKSCNFDCSSLILESESSYEDFIRYTNDQLIRSYEYLFLSAQFGTHMKDRPGFEKVLHGLADGAWNKGFEMIKESAKRGVSHKFKYINADSTQIKVHGDVSEVLALAKAAEIEKKLLIRANDIHRHHSHATLNDAKAIGYDSGIAHFLEEEIIEEKTKTLRNLVGHVNDLKNLYKQDSAGGKIFSLSLYLFDQYLQK